MTKKASKPAPKKTAAPAPTPAAPAESTKIAKKELVEMIADKAGLTKAQTSQVIDAALESMVEAIKSGRPVSLPGLGTLTVKATAARTGVRPGTSEKIQIPAGKKLAFKVSTSLKGAL